MKRVMLVVLLASAPACLHTAEVDPSPPLAVPGNYGWYNSADLPEQWWRDFGDDDLTGLIEQTLIDNFELKSAWARLEQVEALAVQASSGLFPSASLEAGFSRQRRAGIAIGTTITPTSETNRFDLSVGATYEVDVWGKMWRQRGAAGLDVLATRDDVESLAMTLAAQVTETWFSLVMRRAQRDLLTEQLHTNETFLELIHLRYDQGLSASIDVYQQRQQVASTAAQLESVIGELEVLEHRLAVLVGRPPDELLSGDRRDLPELPPLPGTGLPADLLQRRPDVRAARRRVEAADHRVGVALADMFPSIRLSGSVGFSAFSPGTLFADYVWNFIAGLTQPIFEGGRRKAEYDRTQAILRESVNSFGHTMVNAMMEVENALARERQQLRPISQLRAQREFASGALSEARHRYTAGLTDFLRVLTALQSQQQIQQSVLAAERQLLSYRIQLCRALGGTWTAQLTEKSDGDV